MTHGSLFNGIGGFQLAAQWMEWENVFSCEIDKFCNKVTKYHFPNCVQHEDIRTTDFRIYRERIDIITGGFPCQPFSTAGKRKGKEDERHLWPEMLRAIREIQPGWVVGENVRGLTNWNRGMVFNEVQAELEAEGYEILPFLLPACAVNAPHRRDRIWFIAHTDGRGFEGWQKPEKGQQYDGGGQAWGEFESFGCIRDASNSIGGKREMGVHNERMGRQREQNEKNRWDGFPVSNPVCPGNDGLPGGLDFETISFSKWRMQSMKAAGNAIVPQVAFEIFKAIEQIRCST